MRRAGMQKSRSDVVVFLGPTMTEAAATQRLDAVYLPPAAQGAFVRAVADYRPRAILLIDGTFQGEPAVRHKEILWALSQGVAVYGAASMGALRAAELHTHGMVGVGLIYRWYRRFPLAPDDAVAVLHGPPEIGSPALTSALVDLRLTFRAAERAGRITRDLRLRLDQTAAELNFRERTLRQVTASRVDGLVGTDRNDMLLLETVLVQSFVHQKRRDAEAALDLVASDLRAGIDRGQPVGGRQFVLTSAFLRDLADAGLSLPKGQGPEPVFSCGPFASMLSVSGPGAVDVSS